MTGDARADGVTRMWLDIGIVALLIVGIYCFVVLAGFQKRMLTRRTERRAEDMYDRFAGSPRRQQRAGEHDGSLHDGQPGDRPGSAR